MILEMRLEVFGVSSDGLSVTLFPAATAAIKGQRAS